MSELDGAAYLTIKEAASKYRVGYQTIYLAIKRGEIDAYKPGRNILLDPASIQQWFAGKKIQAAKPVGRPRRVWR